MKEVKGKVNKDIKIKIIKITTPIEFEKDEKKYCSCRRFL